MFSGIVEEMGKIVGVQQSEGGNRTFRVWCNFLQELKVDQSVSHNGACLTVERMEDSFYEVTAIQETLQKTNLSHLQVGMRVNLERAMKLGDRLDGHMVQGHVDTTGICTHASETNGSWYFGFSYHTKEGHLTVPKGSICVNGVSLTVVESTPGYFSVAIIPYTFAHTTFADLRKGDTVNLEFDVLGKYMYHYFKQLQLTQQGI
jgi:riboflavin synthase